MRTRRKIRRYTLEERKNIFSRPLEQQFVPVFKSGEAVVFRHLIRSPQSEDYERVLDVARALAVKRQGPVYILPEINAHEKTLRASLGLSVDNGKTPDIMIDIGDFVDIKSPASADTISSNACKAYKQGGIVCITDHSTTLSIQSLDQYSRWVLDSQGYHFDVAYFYIERVLYKRTRE